MTKFCVSLISIVLTIYVQQSHSFLFGNNPDWNNLRVTFGINPLSSSNFVEMPRTVNDAASKGFQPDTTAPGCNATANGFVGRRFVRVNGDRSIMLLFDNAGYIAGIQTTVPKSLNYPTNAEKAFHNVWIEERSSNTLTAYWVDPDRICKAGRTAQEFKGQGTGDRLLFQIGRANNTTVQYMTIPLKESDVQRTQWTKGKCFIMMGQHYWYNMRPNMNCSDFYPAFLLYNGGKLDGFGFAMAVNFEGQHFEHPTLEVTDKFFPFLPTCMKQPGYTNTFSTVHIYMYERPWLKTCLA